MEPTAINPAGLTGIEFVEFAAPNPDQLHELFLELGFSRTMRHASRPVDLYQQEGITFLVNRDPRSFASEFSAAHGPCICSMGWRVQDGARALLATRNRGARAASGDHRTAEGSLPAIYGIGESLIYFVDGKHSWGELGYRPLERPDRVKSKGFFAIDHLTNNVAKGTLQTWSDFYKRVFGFTEVRYFDIRGVKTGLTSYALRSPDGSFAIPINEADEAKSQINEYLAEYKGPGIQHLAFATRDLLGSLDALAGSRIQFLDIDADYYAEVFRRVPGVTEPHDRLARAQVLIDGDDQGYLLQIFTRNLVGPIFIELIQRKNHASFGEGNFSALFRSIERDQMRRGVL